MRVVTLASGSSGNATLVEAGTTALLVDAGLSARTLVTRLRAAGRSPADLTGIVLTHEHGDHVAGALTFAAQYHVPIHADARTLAALRAAPGTDEEAACEAAKLVPQPVGTKWAIGELAITSFAVPHDAAAPCGYLIGTAAWHMCLVTDCGEMNDSILHHMKAAQLIIIEANHDRARLLRGPYTTSLKRRILSPTGHLANDQTAAALDACLDEDPRWVWLAHLSRTNNTPDLARTAMADRLGARRLRVTKLAVAPPSMGLTWDSAHLLAGHAMR
jgi:phosphoribosyl 1,2-cyclic phosphodiesterase